MKVTKEQVETNVVSLEITVESDEFEKAVQKAYLKNVKSITLPGFRKGKAPRKLIEKTYGEGIFYEDAADEVLQNTYPQAIEDEKLEPVSRPEIEVKEIGSGKDFVYTAKVTLKPAVKMNKYKGLKVKKIEYGVTDEEIDKEIDIMKERVARFVDVEDRPAEMGDVAVIDYEGSVDGVKFDGGTAQNHNLTLGSGQFIPGFEEQIAGHSVNDEFDVNVTFPEEYHAADLAGKAAVFKVKLNGIKKKEYPEIDDEFAKDVSEYDTLEELKEKTKEKLLKNAEERAKRDQEEVIIDEVLKKLKAEIPDVMVENKIDEFVSNAKYQIQSQMPGITFEQYLEYTGSSVEDFRENSKENALRNVKIDLAFEYIAKENNIEVSDEEVEEELKKIAEQYKMELDKVKEMVNSEAVKESLLPRKIIDFLVSETNIA